MEETETDDIVTVGQRLREAREAKGLSIEDVASTTRIPMRHLASLEISDWDALPAATYSIGFAKNYAVAVGLDRAEIGDALRAEMGGSRPAMASPEVYEAVDPARAMPKGLVFGALALVLLAVIGFTWLSNRSVEGDALPPEVENMLAPAENQVIATPVPAATGPVVLTANEPVWIQIKDGGTILKQGELAAGQSYEVPATAVAPLLTTGKPEALRISVGTADAPTVGPAGQRVAGVSLRAVDLLKGPQQASSPLPATPAAATSVVSAPRPATTRSELPPVPPAVDNNSVSPAAPAQ